jgi:hypothetical protein
MKLEPVGRIKDIDLRDLEPITVPVISYTEDKEEVLTDIRFQPIAPLNTELEMLRSIDVEGNINQKAVIAYVDGCVYPGDRQKWNDLLAREDVYTYPETLSAVYRAIGEHYTNRPTVRRSGSQGGRGSTRTTSQAAASEKASKLKVSP